MTRSMTAAVPTAARRRTDLIPATCLRDATTRGSPRHRSPGRTMSLTRLDQLARPKLRSPSSLAPLHEKPKQKHPQSVSNNKPRHSMSKSMSHLGPPGHSASRATNRILNPGNVIHNTGKLDRKVSRSSVTISQSPRVTRTAMLRQQRRNSSGNTNGSTLTQPTRSSANKNVATSGNGNRRIFLHKHDVTLLTRKKGIEFSFTQPVISFFEIIFSIAILM